jgi:hypothetical protein
MHPEDVRPEYLEPAALIRWDGSRLPERAARLTAGIDDEADRARSLFLFVRDQVKYNPYSPFWLPEHYYPENVLDRGYGYCVQKSALLVALLRISGIPARMVFADIRNHRFSAKLLEYMGADLFTYHAYVDLFVGGKWIQATPSFEKELADKLEIFPVDFNGRETAVLHHLDRLGQVHIEYVRDIGVFADVPLGDLLAAWDRVYGAERVQLWRQAFEGGLSQDALA